MGWNVGMNSKDSEMLDYLVKALERLRLEYATSSPKEKIDLGEALIFIEKAKALGKPSDLLLLEELETELKRLNGTSTSKENLKALEQLYSQFCPEVFMSKASLGLDEEQYNTFLTLIENPEVIGFFRDLVRGTQVSLSSDKIDSLVKLRLIKKVDSKIVLTESGIYVARAADFVQT